MKILPTGSPRLFSLVLRLTCAIVLAIVVLSMTMPLGSAASALRRASGVKITKGQLLADRLPDLSRVRNKEPWQPRIAELRGASETCHDCTTRAVDAAVGFARFDAVNRTGSDGIDLYSGNYKWTQSLVRLPGRAKLDLSLDLVYNSLIWTRVGTDMWFDADRGFPAPGFQLGFARIQGPFRHVPDGPASYLLLTTAGARVELAQVAPQLFESKDGSLLRLVARDVSRLLLRTPDGTTATYAQAAGQWQATRIEDRNGNYVTAAYTANGHLKRIEDTAGRTVDLVYNAGGSLVRIVQRSGSDSRTLATFAYESIALRPGFTVGTLRGLEQEQRIVMLSKLGLPDGSVYAFQYTGTGQLSRLVRHAPDGHVLTTVTYDLPTGSALADNPQPSAMRAWAESLNNEQDTVTTVTIDRAAGTGRAMLSDGSSIVEVFGTSDWQRGLSLDRREREPDGTAKETQTVWQKVDLSPTAFRVVRRSETTTSVENGGTQDQVFTAFDSLGLPRDVSHSRNGAFMQRIRTQYLTAPEYVERQILRLPARQDVYGAEGQLVLSTSYSYDLPGTVIDQSAIAHHNSAVYGASMLRGRALLSKITRTSAQVPASTEFTYSIAGSVLEVSDSNGRRVINGYEDAFSDGVDRGTFAYVTSVATNGSATQSTYDFSTGQPVRLQTNGGEVHALTYDNAGRLVARLNQTTGAGARRVFDETGTLVTTFVKKAGARREFTNYKVLDGAGFTRARALGGTRRAQGYKATVTWRDGKGRRIRSTTPINVNDQWIAQEDAIVPGASTTQMALNRAASGLDAAQRRLSATIGRAAEWLQPTVRAQQYCDPGYYGYDQCIEDANNWFCGGEWGYDYYDTWSDVYDALTWNDDWFNSSSFWNGANWAFGQTDPAQNVMAQLWASTYGNFTLEMEWTGKGYSGRFDSGVFDALSGDPNFASGWLYGMHRDVGDNLRDFRSYSGTFGEGSLQIVIDQQSGRFWIDVDRFNPYQDVVGFFGHAFVEVLPSLFKKIF